MNSVIAPPELVTTVVRISLAAITLWVAPVVIEIFGGAAVTVNVNSAVDVAPAVPVAVTV